MAAELEGSAGSAGNGRSGAATAFTDEVHALVNEERSLRNLAMLVAKASPSDDVLTAICREASDLLGGQEVTLMQFETADTVLAVATHCGPLPLGVRALHHRGSLADRVASTGLPVRVDDFRDQVDFDLAARHGIQAAVAVPVFIQGQVWGMVAASSQLGPLPAGTETRLARFAELTWAAVANAEARKSLRRLADEQAALRRVAELVARRAPLAEVFHAVLHEAGRILNACSAAVLSGDDDEAVVLAKVVLRPDPFRHHAAVPITVEGARWGSLEVQTTHMRPRAAREGLRPFADLASAAVANAKDREGLTQSRARVIAAGDEARRRLQRDVHDGAQQRLVHTIITLKFARDRMALGESVDELLAEALVNAEDANRQLRDTVRGVLPAALIRGGLAAGIRSLADAAPLPVHVDLAIPRLPTAVETTGYFTVAEAITNAVKHAGASRIRVTGALSAKGDEVVLTVADDGAGGADPALGTGLLGLADRIEAANGALTITTAAGRGTELTARIPCGSVSRDDGVVHPTGASGARSWGGNHSEVESA